MMSPNFAAASYAAERRGTIRDGSGIGVESKVVYRIGAAAYFSSSPALSFYFPGSTLLAAVSCYHEKIWSEWK